MTSKVLLEMFEGNSADMCAVKFPLTSMGAERRVSRAQTRERGPHRRERKFLIKDHKRTCRVVQPLKRYLRYNLLSWQWSWRNNLICCFLERWLRTRDMVWNPIGSSGIFGSGVSREPYKSLGPFYYCCSSLATNFESCDWSMRISLVILLGSHWSE